VILGLWESGRRDPDTGGIMGNPSARMAGGQQSSQTLNGCRGPPVPASNHE